jgi:hypothetical protein
VLLGFPKRAPPVDAVLLASTSSKGGGSAGAIGRDVGIWLVSWGQFRKPRSSVNVDVVAVDFNDLPVLV